MKNYRFLVFMAIILFMSACTTSKVARQSENTLRGNWILTDIVNDKESTLKISNLFDHASVDCFEGSTWYFIENNSTGTYNLEGADCPSGENRIKWYMEQDGPDTYFYFKNLDEADKSKDVRTGYKMRLVSIDENQVHLVHEIPFEGEKVTMDFYFNKQ